jgi:transcriptional regulator, araC family
LKPAAIPTNSPEILNRLPPNKNHHFRNKVYNTLYTDTRGWTWAGTPDGLELFTSENDSAPRIFYRENGLSNNFIQGIIEDKYRDIWVTTSNGVTRIHINPENKNISFTRFNQLDGALDGEYIKDAVFSSSDGTLYLGGIDGFSIFHPDKDSIHPMLPDPPVFTALRLYGEKVNTGKEYGNRIILSKAAPYTTEIELDYNQNFLTFEFSALNYINHERTYYRYQLEGIDPQWMSTFAGRQGNATVGKGLLQAVYTNLPPGDYTFKVMASDNPLQWNGKVTAIKLTIHAPWWKTTTAYILYAVILLLIAFTGSRLYIYWSRKEMERKHKEEILLLRIRNLIEQNNSLTCGIEETSPDHQQQDTEESAFLAQAIKLVEQNLHVNGYSVEQLSRDLCMERTGLYRKLVTMLDQSPSLFIRNIRLQRAAQLITEGKLSITEIAEHTGFSSSSYLSKCFQEMYGCRPSEYAEKAKEST